MDIESAAEALQNILREYKGLEHLRVNKRGQSLTICSGDPKNPWPHARLTRVGKTSNHWQLSFPNHRGRWEKTPFIDSLTELTSMLIRDFGFHLQNFDSF